MTKWRNKIDIKRYFVDEQDDENVSDVSEVIVSQLKHIYGQEEKRNADLWILDSLDEIIGHFETIIDEITNGTNSTEYDFSSWTEAFNEYLGQLYDLGDTVISSENDSYWRHEKFLWVG